MLAKPNKQWFQYGVLHGGIVDCFSNEYPSIFNLLTDADNLQWIQRNAFNELIGKLYIHWCDPCVDLDYNFQLFSDNIFRNSAHQSSLRTLTIEGNLDEIKLLLESEKRINPIVDKLDDGTPISLMHLAAKEGKLEIVKHISEKLYEKNPASPSVAYGQTPLHAAASLAQWVDLILNPKIILHLHHYFNKHVCLSIYPCLSLSLRHKKTSSNQKMLLIKVVTYASVMKKIQLGSP